MQSGWIMSVVTAIDFTASNGDPMTGESNHCISEEEPNDYEKVLQELCNAILVENFNDDDEDEE